MSDFVPPPDHRAAARKALREGDPRTATAYALLSIADDLRYIRDDVRNIRRQSDRKG